MTKRNSVRKSTKGNGKLDELLAIVLQTQAMANQQIIQLGQRQNEQEKLMNEIITTLNEHTRLLNEHTQILNQILESQRETKKIIGFSDSF